MRHSYKIFFFTLIICSLVFFGYSYAATQGQLGASCQTQEDCLQPKCIDCGSLCLNNKCTFVRCKDHGSYDKRRNKCVCMQDYTGQYCETHVSSLPKKQTKPKATSPAPANSIDILAEESPASAFQSLGSCQTVADCPPPECPACEMTCEHNLCVSRQCMDHGRYDFETQQCICNDGYKGNYCEQQTANAPTDRPNKQSSPAVIKQPNASALTNQQEKCYYSSTKNLQWVRYYNDKQEVIAALFYCPDGRLNGKYLKNANGDETKLCGKNLEPSLPCGVSIYMELDSPCNPQGKGLFCNDDL